MGFPDEAPADQPGGGGGGTEAMMNELYPGKLFQVAKPLCFALLRGQLLKSIFSASKVIQIFRNLDAALLFQSLVILQQARDVGCTWTPDGNCHERG